VSGTRQERIQASSTHIMESFQSTASRLNESGLDPECKYLLLLYCLNAKLVHHLSEVPIR
jgi:hypothetical protein